MIYPCLIQTGTAIDVREWVIICIALLLTYLPLVPHIYISDLGQHWFM